ncbi:hypothetical protein AD998_00960 [bacterium 336/3]|nr:hypothetical protein AD998_00960 [bacterium 336/3]
MKKLCCFVFLVFLACTHEEDTKISHNHIKIIVQDSSKYHIKKGAFNPSGMYEGERFILNLCFYSRNIDYPKLSIEKTHIDSLTKKGIIPKEDSNGNLIEYNLNKKNRQVVYYEITDKKSWQKHKTIGRLYSIGTQEKNAIGGGDIYISDTTSKFGWFVVQTHPVFMPSGYIPKKTLKSLKITSTEHKANELCHSEYSKISNSVYRIILDEEVKK